MTIATSNTEKGENIVAFTWTVESLKEHFTTLMRETDRRYEERFIAQEKAAKDTLTATKEAILKAEAAAEKRFEGVNEFRQTLSDQASTFMPRIEAVQRADNNTEKIIDLSSRLDRMQGHTLGISTGWAVLIAAIGAIGTLVALASILMR